MEQNLNILVTEVEKDIKPIFEEIDKICFLARPMDFAISIMPGEKRKEIFRIGVRCNPIGAKETLIELDDTPLLQFKPTVREGN